MHWLLHVLGIDTQQSDFYDFWSGIATQASLIFGALAVYKHHNCHKHLCWRVGRYQVGQYLVCKKHHPDHPGKVGLEHIMFEHKKNGIIK